MPLLAGSANDEPRITDHYHRLLFYLLTLLFFALGLMSKPMLVTLPFVMLLLDYWPLRRLELNTKLRTQDCSSLCSWRSSHSSPCRRLRAW